MRIIKAGLYRRKSRERPLDFSHLHLNLRDCFLAPLPAMTGEKTFYEFLGFCGKMLAGLLINLYNTCKFKITF